MCKPNRRGRVSQFSVEQKREFAKRHAGGESYASIGAGCGVTSSCIRNAVKRLQPDGAANAKQQPRPRTPRDLVGFVFGYLTVLRLADVPRGRGTFWVCRCECGRETTVSRLHLVTGNTRSCGCKKRVHGYNGTPTYRSWLAMRGRCEDPGHHAKRNYSDRGVIVCEGWKSFANFLADMGERPSSSHSIDRINNATGSYTCGRCPQCVESGHLMNCKWSTDSEQNRNRRDNNLITYNGETLCVVDWAERTGLHKAAIYSRVRAGWSAERTLTTPSRRASKAMQKQQS